VPGDDGSHGVEQDEPAQAARGVAHRHLRGDPSPEGAADDDDVGQLELCEDVVVGNMGGMAMVVMVVDLPGDLEGAATRGIARMTVVGS